MTLADLTLRRLAIPFRAAFRHAAADRDATESAWVEARSQRGAIGWGESCPRRYVTGEDLPSVSRFFLRHRCDLIRRIADVGDLLAWSYAHRDDIDRHPAAWCALELALLDVLAKDRDISVEALLGLREVSGTYRYSAVVGVGGSAEFRATVERYAAAGFDDFKLKLSGDRERDREHIAWLRRSAAAARLRVDANNLWATVEEAARYVEALEASLVGIEEPLPPRRWADLAALTVRTGTPMILDESCTRVADLSGACAHGDRWIVNVRVSKMGGILRALRVVDVARASGIRIVVGAHVGETSVLTRAALTVAAQARDLVVAQEGAFGTHLLRADVCDPPLTFGPGGLLVMEHAARAGFGVSVRRDLQSPTVLP
jgi:L-alanine-DL-glutamate epimerase-like enolase superfamily enzyme